MCHFSLQTHWTIPAPLKTVWPILQDTGNWPKWWPYVARVEQVAAGDAFGINNIRRYHWKTCLPYRLSIDLKTTRFIPYRLVVADVSGDLSGQSRCRVSGSTQQTYIEILWQVNLTKNWMKRLSPYADLFYIWNHNQVMRSGEKGLRHFLEQNAR